MERTATWVSRSIPANCHYVAVHHLEGDFPGGVVDLRFRFTLREGRIAELVIKP
jgi:hypothetical protein